METSACRIRTATHLERRALEELQLRASLMNEGDRPYLLENPGVIQIPPGQIDDGLVFVAEVAREIRGFAALLPRTDAGFDLDGLFVEPQHMRHGIGRDLVKHCLMHLRQQGATALHVVANPHALDFYRSVGFLECGREQTQFGPAILMRLKTN